MSTLAGQTSLGAHSTAAPSDRAVARWLFVVAAMVFAIVVLGGYVRLTESGLSIVEWQPIRGILPPSTHAEWHTLFEQYRQTPQFQRMFPDLTLEGFKAIFWPEYLHRLWGRLIGVVFIVPLLWFWIRGRIPRARVPGLVLLLLLGGAQGALGWFMVASGLVERPSVSPHRLAAHLLLAILLYTALLRSALSWNAPRQRAKRAPLAALVLYSLLALTIFYGALVAGWRAGWIYNEFPAMGGALLPHDYWVPHLGWASLFESHAAVQFNHRLLATATLVASGALVAATRRTGPARVRTAAALLAVATLFQYLLGITTLLIFGEWRPPHPLGIAFGTLHQGSAMLVITAAVWFAHAWRRPAGSVSAPQLGAEHRQRRNRETEAQRLA
jgi:cytochrome c oxidase assembly protein subunit 15